MTGFDERFASGHLDESRWIASYLPAWSSRERSAATYRVGADGLRLWIPPEHPRWCPGSHDDPPLRVSAVQTGNWSGPVGSPRGQQPFREGLRVSEAQVEMRGFVSQYARVEVECRANLSAGSMFSAWMIGMEDEPWRCGEICIVEVFGETVTGTGSAISCGLGSGVHAFRDPALIEEFSVEERALNVAEWHTYAVDWRSDGIDWYVDGARTRSSRQSPGYPMLVILAVFDFPGRSDPNAVPELQVRRIRGRSRLDGI